MAKSKLDKMTDEELIKIINQTTPDYYNMLERLDAEIVLHNRKKKKESWMLRITFLILILTLILVGLAFFDRSSKKSNSHAKTMQSPIRNESPYKSQDTNSITNKKQLPNHVEPPKK